VILVTSEIQEYVGKLLATIPPPPPELIADLRPVILECWAARRTLPPRRVPAASPQVRAASGLQPLVYTVAEAAVVLKVSKNWLRDKARAHAIPHSMIGGSHHFTPRHLDDFIRLFERSAEKPLMPRLAASHPAAPLASPPGEVPVLQARTPRGPHRKKSTKPPC
jgi:excisionase family DNA binding protein